MRRCEYCGKNFDPEEAEDYFIDETYLLAYDNLKKCLCGECAVSAIEDQDEGVYYETCECCGKTFDLALEEAEFASHFSECSGTTLRDYWKDKIMCADCAIMASEDDLDDSDEDDYDSDSKSPACCACGNPNYPQCMDSCSMFDD